MTTTAIPIGIGRCLSSWVTADKPPAEAPIPITGNEDAVREFFPERRPDSAFRLAGLDVLPLLDFRDFAIIAFSSLSVKLDSRPENLIFISRGELRSVGAGSEVFAGGVPIAAVPRVQRGVY
jgi:hypothetical protein